MSSILTRHPLAIDAISPEEEEQRAENSDECHGADDDADDGAGAERW